MAVGALIALAIALLVSAVLLGTLSLTYARTYTIPAAVGVLVALLCLGGGIVGILVAAGTL